MWNVHTISFSDRIFSHSIISNRKTELRVFGEKFDELHRKQLFTTFARKKNGYPFVALHIYQKHGTSATQCTQCKRFYVSNYYNCALSGQSKRTIEDEKWFGIMCVIIWIYRETCNIEILTVMPFVCWKLFYTNLLLLAIFRFEFLFLLYFKWDFIWESSFCFHHHIKFNNIYFVYVKLLHNITL